MPGKRGRGRRVGPSVRTLIKAKENGRVLRVPPNPPPVVETPWNHLVLQLTATGDVAFTGKLLFPYLLNQAGLTSAQGCGIDMKIQMVRCWNLNPGNPIRASFYGFDNTKSSSGGALAVIDDYPGRLNFAAIGYEFPTSVQNIVYSEDSTAKFVQVDVAPSDQWLSYVNILWRGNKYTPFTSNVRYQASIAAHALASTSTATDISQAISDLSFI